LNADKLDLEVKEAVSQEKMVADLRAQIGASQDKMAAIQQKVTADLKASFNASMHKMVADPCR